MSERAVGPIGSALGRIPSGLFVVTAREGEREGAFLASWVMQAGFDPPSVTLALGADRPLRPLLESAGARWAVSVLGRGQRSLLGPFARGIAPAEGALDELPVERTPGGLAVVRGCLAWLQCRSRGAMEGGDHLVLLGEVDEAWSGEGDPLVHLRADGLRY